MRFCRLGQKICDSEVALFRVLERALVEALEQANDVGYLDGWDRADGDVPSVASHPQNAHRFGFYPIVRALADLWERIAGRQRDTARGLVSGWSNSPYLIVRRLYLFAICSEETFGTDEAWAVLQGLDDQIFWIGSAQVEIMRLATSRWQQLSEEGRRAFEERIRLGLPRSLFPDSAFENEEEWASVRDSAIMKRLARLEGAGGPIAAESQTLLNEITGRHPRWVPGPGDRDDFSVWHESRSGPRGEAGLLANIADDALVAEAMRVQQEQLYEQGDLWRIFCAADPERALRGLRLAAGAGRWEVSPWRELVWAATYKGDEAFQFELARLLIGIPERTLAELLPAASSWLQERRPLLENAPPGETDFLTLSDRFADLAYPADFAPPDDEERLLDRALSEPAGSLAWTFLDYLNGRRPAPGTGFSPETVTRLTRSVCATGRPGLLAQSHSLPFLGVLRIDRPQVGVRATNSLSRLGSTSRGDNVALTRVRPHRHRAIIQLAEGGHAGGIPTACHVQS